jgi:hypothetical protein
MALTFTDPLRSLNIDPLDNLNFSWGHGFELLVQRHLCLPMPGFGAEPQGLAKKRGPSLCDGPLSRFWFVGFRLSLVHQRARRIELRFAGKLI